MTEPEPTEPADELLAVAPLLAQEPAGRRLLGPCILLRARDRVVGFASRALFAGVDACVVATCLDGRVTARIGEPEMTRDAGIAAFVLNDADWSKSEVVPLDPQRIGVLDYARRGLPFVVGIKEREGGYERTALRVAIEVIDTADWAGSGDEPYYRARARDPLDEEAKYEGAPLFARHPASRVLGRPAETLAYGFARTLSDDAQDVTREGERAFAELVPMPSGYGL